jgi:hypothetical protein
MGFTVMLGYQFIIILAEGYFFEVESNTGSHDPLSLSSRKPIIVINDLFPIIEVF